MRIQLALDSDDPKDIEKAKRILTILEREDEETDTARNDAITIPAPSPGSVSEIEKIVALAKTRTGQPLREAAQQYQAGQQFSLAELGSHIGWNGSKSVSWYAKFSRTCKSWGVHPLQRHQGYPKRYSMTEEVRQAVLRAVPSQTRPQS